MARPKNRISSITVQGFKSICAEQSLTIRPLTILAGANSSGKSSFIQPLLLLKQTLEAPGDPGALLLDGPNVRFTMAEQLFSRVLGKECGREFAIRVELLEGKHMRLVFHREEGKGVELASMTSADGKESLTVVPGMGHDAIMGVLPQPLKSFHQDFEKREKTAFRWAVRRERCFFTFELTSTAEPKRQVTFGPFGISPSVEFVTHIQGTIHLPGLRGNPRRTYPRTSGGPEFPGTFEPYVASVITQWQADPNGKLASLGKTLEAMGLTWKVKAERVDDTQVELKVGRLPHSRQGGARDLVSIADVGFGVSQSLPVVVALLAAKPGQLVYLEQPEIHLHPLAQRRLAGVLRDAVERGVVSVVETHSALLLREVQTLVARGELRKEDVALHWLQRDQEGGTTVQTAEVDDQGAYGNWPEDFAQTELQAEQAYLDAVESKGTST